MTVTLQPAREFSAPNLENPPARRYLHINPRYYPYIGGSEYYMQQIAERLANCEIGSEVTMYTTDAWDLEHFWADGKRRIKEEQEVLNRVQVRRFKVRRLPVVSPLFYPAMRRLLNIISESPLPNQLAIPTLNQLCQTTPLVPSLAHYLKQDQQRFDLVHVANAPLDSLIRAGYNYARRYDVPFLITPFVHLGEPENRAVRRWYTMRHQLEWMKQADAVFAMTTLERDYLAEMGVPEAKIHIVGVGIEPQEIQGGNAQRFRQKHGLHQPIVFYQGTAAYEKGTMHLVRAMRQLWRQGVEAQLVLAGPSLSSFDKFLKEQPAADRQRITHLGFISPEDKRDLFAAGDIFAMPSRTDSFGIVYLEAWLCGKPVIGARAGGVPAVIDHTENGLLVKFGAVEELAGAIKNLLDNPGLATRLGLAGQAKTLNCYNWQQVFGNIYQVYRQTLS